MTMKEKPTRNVSISLPEGEEDPDPEMLALACTVALRAVKLEEIVRREMEEWLKKQAE